MAMNKNEIEAVRKWVSEKDSDITPEGLARKTRAGSRFTLLLLLDVLDKLEALELQVQKFSKKNPT